MLTEKERDEICSYVAQNFVSPLCFDYDTAKEAYLDLSGDKFNQFCAFMRELIDRANKEESHNPLCPNCGAELELDDVYDTSGHNDYCVGHCPKCNRDYQWISLYGFLEHCDIVEA